MPVVCVHTVEIKGGVYRVLQLLNPVDLEPEEMSRVIKGLFDWVVDIRSISRTRDPGDVTPPRPGFTWGVHNFSSV